MQAAHRWPSVPPEKQQSNLSFEAALDLGKLVFGGRRRRCLAEPYISNNVNVDQLTSYNVSRFINNVWNLEGIFVSE